MADLVAAMTTAFKVKAFVSGTGFRGSPRCNQRAQIVVHSAGPPKSNPNISQFAQNTVVFWADSNCVLGVPVCGALLDKNNKKTESHGVPPALRQ
jgi:hypothetical protein